MGLQNLARPPLSCWWHCPFYLGCCRKVFYNLIILLNSMGWSYSDVPSHIPNTANVALLFVLISLTWDLSILLIFAKNQLHCSFLLFSSSLFYFCSDLYNSFPFTNFVFVCSFCSSIRCKFRSYIWNFSYFQRSDGIALIFPLRIVFVVHHRFCIIVFLFSSLYIFFFSLISSVIT